jgi:aryl carrier-like protein
MVSTWGAPVAPAPAAHAAHSAHAARPDARTRPDPVTAAAVVGFVVGGLFLLMAALVLFLYLEFRGQLDAAGVAGPVDGLDQLLSAVSTLLLTLLGISLAGGLLYVLAATAVIRGRVWGAWTLLVLGALSTLKAVYDLVTSGLPSVSTAYLVGWWTSIGLAVVLVVLLLRPDSQRWMRGGTAAAGR